MLIAAPPGGSRRCDMTEANNHRSVPQELTMQPSEKTSISRRSLFAAGAAAFMIVPRHVLGGQGHVAPSDKVTIASIGLGRQGMAITEELLSRPDVQVVAVCDCNREGRTY